MICEECKQRPASVHFTKIINGEKTETHLCDQCARQRSEQLLLEPSFTFHNILAGLFEPETMGLPAGQQQVVQRMRCENCGLSFADFRRLGHLGCSECHVVFSQQLEPVLRRIHGSTVHAGKIPARQAGPLRLQRELEGLRQELKEAIGKEDYERAAVLRDRIRLLERHGG